MQAPAGFFPMTKSMFSKYEQGVAACRHPQGLFVNQKCTFSGQPSIPEEPGGRRPTGSGGLGGEAPQWKGSSIYFLYIRETESLSRT